MKKQLTILLFSFIFFQSFFITKSAFAACISPVDMGYQQCGERERYEIDNWYANQKADLRRRGLTFSGAAIALDNEYQQKISWCEEDNDNYIEALNDYEKCLEQEMAEQKQTCTSYSWSCNSWSACSSNGTQTRSCNKISDCEGGTSSPATTQLCIYYPPQIDSNSGDKCEQISKNIKYWMDLDNSSINPNGLPFSPSDLSEMRESRHQAVVAQLKNLLDLAKSYQCGSETKCSADTWQCGNWGTCSPQGIQTRSCSKTFDCPSVETAAPTTSQYCEPTYQKDYQIPSCTSFTYSDWGVCNSSGVQSRNLLSSYPSNCVGGNLILTQSCQYQIQQVLGAQIDMNLSKRVKGRLLLQVEQGGAIWYVDTKEFKRYSVTWANALPLFKKLSLGITDADLAKIPIANSGQTGNISMRNRLKGKLLLQVQQGGAIWYVDQNGYRHSVTWNNLMDLFKKLALGITNENLYKISEGNLE